MNTVKKTTDYDKFKFIDANRDQNRGHVEKIKAAFAEIGNLTKVQPILVNEKMQIIDGQHRFIAAKELEQPVYYTQMTGLGIAEARQMNILHRGWTVQDYANSYALTGNQNYIKYLRLKEDYGFGHTVILSCTTEEGHATNILRDFREGNFVIHDEDAAVEKLEFLSDLAEVADIVAYRPIALALLKLVRGENFDKDRMLKKIKVYGHKLERIDDIDANLRQLESIYNTNVAVSAKARLY